jgi:hypothetical protein
MCAIEFTIELTSESVVPIPKEVAAELPKAGVARIIILTDEHAEDTQWQRGAYQQFLRNDAPEDAIYDTYK